LLSCPLNRASNRVAAQSGMPDLDTGVIDLCRRTPRKWKSKTRPFRHMTSMAPNTVPRRTQDKRQTNCCASEFSHSYEFNSMEIQDAAVPSHDQHGSEHSAAPHSGQTANKLLRI